MSVVQCLQILLQVHKIVTTNNKEEKIRIRYQTPGVAGALLPRPETRVAPLELPGARARASKEVFIAFTSLSKIALPPEASVFILISWILYVRASQSCTHIGTFFGHIVTTKLLTKSGVLCCRFPVL